MTLDEIFVAFATHVGDDQEKAKQVAKALRDNSATSIIANELISYGAGRKKSQLDKDIAKLEIERDAALTERDEVRTEFDEFKAKAPDVAAIETRLTEKHSKKLKELESALQAKDGTLKGALVDVRTEQAVARAVSDHRVDPEYAREVLKPRLARRMKPNDDGKVTILQFGSDDTYDADSDDKAMDLLLQDAVKSVPPKFVLSSADRGGGSGGSGSGSSNTKVLNEDELAEKARASGLYRGIF